MGKSSKENLAVFPVSFNKHIDENVKNSISELDKTLEVAVNKLVTEGWTLPVELPIVAVYTLGNSNKLDDVNVFMTEFYTYDNYRNMRKMIAGIQQSKINTGLVKMITQCWQAFQEKLYAICATSLLVIVEGVVSQYSDDKQNVKMMKVCQTQVDTFPKDGSIFIKHVWISYNQYIRKLFQKSDFTASEPNYVNRHWLLHGRSDFEIEEVDCVKIFNAIHSLCMVINKDFLLERE